MLEQLNLGMSLNSDSPLNRKSGPTEVEQLFLFFEDTFFFPVNHEVNI